MRLIVKISILIICFYSCNSDKFQKTHSDIFRYNESKGITSLDPAFAKDQKLIWPVNQIFNGLVQMDDSLNVLPCIAKRWEISDDRKVYTFYLRNDVFFHDNEVFTGGKGRLVNAPDFEYSFDRITDSSIASPGRWIFERLEKKDDHPGGFKAINDSTFRIWLSLPFPPFLEMLTMPYCCVVPKEAVNRYGIDFGRNPVGT
jgi:ABC-type transport system substrate-binding protein